MAGARPNRKTTNANAGPGPVGGERAATASATTTLPDTPAAPAAPTSTAPGAPSLPPPRRRRQPRMQLNTRIPGELYERLQSFIDQHDAAVQDVVEGALTEYLDRRS